METDHNILLESGTNEMEILEFYINTRDGSQHAFGINVAKVLEILESPGLKPIPSAPHPCFMGVMSLRGSALPVLDLAVWLHLDRLAHPHDVVMVTEINKTITGFLVSGVTQIHRVSWGDVEPPGTALDGQEGSCITALAKVAGKFIQLLDLERMLSELGQQVAPPAARSAADGRQRRAMVADDSSAIRGMLVRNLEADGFTVVTAGDGEDALRKLMAFKAQAVASGGRISDLLDVLVSDVEMPRMDGYTLTRKVKEDPALKDIPVILFSSLISDAIRHKGVAVGADEQISKPEFGELAERAKALIAARDRA
jgi:chemotaxis signal transduction protein/CheY-like chemotaxis protein